MCKESERPLMAEPCLWSCEIECPLSRMAYYIYIALGSNRPERDFS